jgi:hypothetical protein
MVFVVLAGKSSEMNAKKSKDVLGDISVFNFKLIGLLEAQFHFLPTVGSLV